MSARLTLAVPIGPTVIMLDHTCDGFVSRIAAIDPGYDFSSVLTRHSVVDASNISMSKLILKARDLLRKCSTIGLPSYHVCQRNHQSRTLALKCHDAIFKCRYFFSGCFCRHNRCLHTVVEACFRNGDWWEESPSKEARRDQCRCDIRGVGKLFGDPSGDLPLERFRGQG